MSFPGTATTGYPDTTDYGVQISSNTPTWTATNNTCGGEGVTIYSVDGNGNHISPTTCGGTYTGTGTQTLYADVVATTSSTPLTATINVATAGGCTPVSSQNLTINQAPASFYLTPGAAAIYQGATNNNIQFTAYFQGAPLPNANYSVTWSVTGSGNGTISNTGLYTPPSPVPTNLQTITVNVTLNLGGRVASTNISVLLNPYVPVPVSVVPASGTGSGGVFTFNFEHSNTPPPPPETPPVIDTATILFSNSLTVAPGASPSGGCQIALTPEYGGITTISLYGTPGGTSGIGSAVAPNTILYTEQCAVFPPNASIQSSGNQLTFQLPAEFYSTFAGTKGIWITYLQNDFGYYVDNAYMGTYTIVAPSETVTPSPVTLNFGAQTQQFTAMAAGNPIPDVTWSTPSAGSLSSAGMYTAPSTLTAQTVTIKGTRTSDGTAICCATVTLAPLSVSPATLTLYAGQTQQFSVAAGGATVPTVTWTMTPTTVGTLTAAGLYTAPSSISANQTITITATNTANSAETVNGTLTLIPVAVSALSPSTVSLQINQTQTFTATVTGTSNQTLNWTLSPSGATSGSVSSAGVYNAPSTIPSSKTVTITATSAADSTKSSSVQITLIPDTLAISPTSAILTAGQSQQFTATVTGTSNAFVNWTMVPSVGTLSSGGYYTAPSAIASQQTIAVTAVSQADASLAMSVNVVLYPASGGSPVLSIAKIHSGNFTQGQQSAAYTITVANAAGTATTSGTVTVTETVPSGLALVSMSGTGWTCGSTSCTRSDALAGGSSYPPITATVNVAASATSPQVNQVSVSGGGAATAYANDSTTVNPSIAASASFVKQDTTTQGTWIGVYGSDGYNVIGNQLSNPSYVTPVATGEGQSVWPNSPTDIRALQEPSDPAVRIAGVWYSSTSFTVDLNITDGNTHQVAVYCLDWDQLGRSETVAITDANGNVLNTQSLSNFGGGVYLVWNVSGHVKIQVTLTSGVNAVVTGLFFGGSSATAAFVKQDTTTQGSWIGVYGSDGYNVIGNQALNPSYVTPVATGEGQTVWPNSPTDIRALQEPSDPAVRIAGVWYSSTSFTVDLNITDGKTHQVAVYCLDWDQLGRSETVAITDANGNVLNTQSLSNFGGGVYLVWNASGHVKIQVTLTSGVNAVVTGLFFEP
jgi:hypothetical protein